MHENTITRAKARWEIIVPKYSTKLKNIFEEGRKDSFMLPVPYFPQDYPVKHKQKYSPCETKVKWESIFATDHSTRPAPTVPGTKSIPTYFVTRPFREQGWHLMYSRSMPAPAQGCSPLDLDLSDQPLWSEAAGPPPWNQSPGPTQWTPETGQQNWAQDPDLRCVPLDWAIKPIHAGPTYRSTPIDLAPGSTTISLGTSLAYLLTQVPSHHIHGLQQQVWLKTLQGGTPRFTG